MSESHRELRTSGTPSRALDEKLARIVAGEYTPADFVIADAKDGDMALGLAAPGVHPDGTPKVRADYLDAMRTMTGSGLVDVMLMSASSAEVLLGEGAFDATAVTPAVRMNDTTDIWSARHCSYRRAVSRPFATVDVESVSALVDLGLYSVTFSNDVDRDRETLLAYRDFRLAVRGTRLRHFLEVFNPTVDIGISRQDLGFYINDMILKALAGVMRADRPLFLKIQYNGAEAMRELCDYDPTGLVVGILGGAKGTTRDTFELAVQAERAGARVALFGRKINLAESPVDLVALLREAIEGSITAEDAVRRYHDRLAAEGIAPLRPLAKDLEITDKVLVR